MEAGRPDSATGETQYHEAVTCYKVSSHCIQAEGIRPVGGSVSVKHQHRCEANWQAKIKLPGALAMLLSSLRGSCLQGPFDESDQRSKGNCRSDIK
jgi:hypothetical protein